MQRSQAYSWVEALVFETVSGNRFTQRSPVMPEVWATFGVEGEAPQDLLFIANWREPVTISLADALAARLGAGLSRAEAEDACAAAGLAPTQSGVVAKLDFRTFLRAGLPLTPYWKRYLLRETRSAASSKVIHEPSAFFQSEAAFRPLRAALRGELERDLRGRGSAPGGIAGRPSGRGAGQGPSSKILEGGIEVTGDLVWLARVVGGMRILHRDFYPDGLDMADEARLEEWAKRRRDPDAVLDALFEVLSGVTPPGEEEPLWSVHRNREARISMRESTATVKADAARKVFGVAGRDIRWAVIDTGIDATHVAFQKRDPAHRGARATTAEHSRIIATYDFTNLRALMALQPRHLEALSTAPAARLPPEVAEQLPEALCARIEGNPRYRADLLKALARTRGQFIEQDDGKAKLVPAGHTLDWEAWDPILQVPHDLERYQPPHHEHGTHVAGILAADWRPEDLESDPVEVELGQPRRLAERKGICPEIGLYDFRALRDDGTADEFTVLAALQYVRALNARNEHVQIHGVNLSLSLLHDVSNYACGQTPVCEECERLVGNGVVVVAAAGNNGMARYVTGDGNFEDGYRTVSITDPGNAPSVITVGATHRSSPHTYGVSFFSSRGPTGDGRLKPDLVAPGEKVMSTVPDNEEKSLDGTSMAAPHVSGAAALLMCRYAELIGKPAEVKRILCKTATDLGRERNFQGAGLLDILRALESV
jgi:serine protease AprX